MPALPSLAVLAAHASFVAQADALAKRLALPAARKADQRPVLACGAALSLHWVVDGQPADFQVDFVAGAQAWRRKHGGGQGEPLARAIAGRQRQALQVLDATTGWARDSFLLANLGHHLWALEREPVVHALVEDGLARAALDASTSTAAARIRYQLAAAETVLAELQAGAVDVIYLDPMFPPRPGHAKVKKDMQALQMLTEHQPPSAEQETQLLNLARRVAGKRVVVKRPDYAPPLALQTPTHVVPAGSNRFDCYLARATDT